MSVPVTDLGGGVPLPPGPCQELWQSPAGSGEMRDTAPQHRASLSGEGRSTRCLCLGHAADKCEASEGNRSKSSHHSWRVWRTEQGFLQDTQAKPDELRGCGQIGERDICCGWSGRMNHCNLSTTRTKIKVSEGWSEAAVWSCSGWTTAQQPEGGEKEGVLVIYWE